jgi:chromosome segregation ATPase
MTDKRTKAQLIQEIEHLQELVKSKTVHIAKINEDMRTLERQRDHFGEEAERLSDLAQGLEKDLAMVREKHGDFIVDAQHALVTTVDVLRTVRPRRERDMQKSAHDRFRSLGGSLSEPRTSVRPFMEIPF